MKKIKKLIRKLTPRSILHKYQLMKEKFQGVDFSTIVQPEEVGLDSKYVVHSSPSGNKYLVRLLEDLRVTDLDSVLDIGCGKGSAMLAMLRFPFASVDGIELSREIAETATRNLTKLKKQRWHVFNENAITFRNYNTYSMLYMYHPFPEPIMRPVVANIHSSIIGREQEVLLIYNNPVCHELIVGEGFSKQREYPDEWGNGIFVYSNKKSQDSRLAG